MVCENFWKTATKTEKTKFIWPQFPRKVSWSMYISSIVGFHISSFPLFFSYFVVVFWTFVVVGEWIEVSIDLIGCKNYLGFFICSNATESVGLITSFIILSFFYQVGCNGCIYIYSLNIIFLKLYFEYKYASNLRKRTDRQSRRSIWPVVLNEIICWRYYGIGSLSFKISKL